MNSELEDLADGFVLVRDAMSPSAVAKLIELVESSTVQEDGRGGVRNLLDIAEFRELAESDALRALVSPVLGDDAFVVRGILFDKTSDANWKVPWHQDVTIAVTERCEAEGYGPWSVKAGVVHVQPPAKVLERMVSVRLHLDDCLVSNGPLRVLPGTHLKGKLAQREIEELAGSINAVTCEAKAGDALLMRPLLLHASSAAVAPQHRRVVHFDYANVELAEGLQWRERRA